jgi:hypothetical protein
MRGKFLPEVIHNEEFEGFAGVNFTVPVNSQACLQERVLKDWY